jgi:thioredoxin 1
MVPHLKEAAKEFGSDVRVVKLDSDKYPRLASALKAGGLPTVILFDGGDVSKEVDRVEGAMTKDQLVAFVKKHF